MAGCRQIISIHSQKRSSPGGERTLIICRVSKTLYIYLWIMLQSLVHETRRCNVYPISTCPLFYRSLLRLPLFLVYCTCSLIVPLLSLVSATATPITSFILQVAATPHLKSTVAMSHYPPQPSPSPTIKLCNRKQGGGIQGGDP